MAVNANTGNPLLSRTPIDVMLGAVPGVAPLVVQALRTAMPNGVSGIVDEITRTLLASSAGVAMTIRSTSASDVGPIVRVGALGANYAFVSPANFTLNGTTPVSLFSAAPLTRINFMGRSSGDFVGNILIEAAGVTYGVIAAGQQTMRSSQYTVPAGYRIFLMQLTAGLAKDSSAGANVVFSLEVKPPASTTWGGVSVWPARSEGSTLSPVSFPCASGLTGPLDLRISGIASVSSIDVQTVMNAILQDLSITQF